MKRWAFLVAFLYALAVVALTVPVLYLAFGKKVESDLGSLSVHDLLIYCGWVAVMFIS